MRIAFAALITIIAGCASSLYGEPRLASLTAADGTKGFRMAGDPAITNDPQALANLITIQLSKMKWCQAGWEETSRAIEHGYLVLQGRCK